MSKVVFFSYLNNWPIFVFKLDQNSNLLIFKLKKKKKKILTYSLRSLTRKSRNQSEKASSSKITENVKQIENQRQTQSESESDREGESI